MSDFNPNSSKKFRPVNSSLGTAPKVGPFPADQVIPWTAICLTSYYICKSVLGLSWLWTGIVAAWGMSTWWVLTGSKAWRFLSKLVSTPTFTRGYARYSQILNTSSPTPTSHKRLSIRSNQQQKRRG
ncbi:hypothetical protein Mic7113_6401 (plasmid) [Allocoleopsis franciscana PCC 7113]|uniref:Uncharacterized protein n=1 Tax=Allocoleopsis franciscana PCC 7113 TaxID=1173027 RepID=K9WP62_9CYAN|nr:hypothetical protein Mic7113_6401 [Allocoleopsis franciscana PCC 7113]